MLVQMLRGKMSDATPQDKEITINQFSCYGLGELGVREAMSCQ
jgi:hypothetical protein